MKLYQLLEIPTCPRINPTISIVSNICWEMWDHMTAPCEIQAMDAHSWDEELWETIIEDSPEMFSMEHEGLQKRPMCKMCGQEANLLHLINGDCREQMLEMVPTNIILSEILKVVNGYKPKVYTLEL